MNITPSDDTAALQQQIDRLTAENNNLTRENQRLTLKADDLKTSVSELERETDINDWMMVNSNLDEGLIEGTVLSIDKGNKTVKLDIFKDDNTPDIDPNIIIPDGIFITRPTAGGIEKYSLIPGSINDLKVGDHFTLHYIGKLKSARAILFTR